MTPRERSDKFYNTNANESNNVRWYVSLEFSFRRNIPLHIAKKFFKKK